MKLKLETIVDNQETLFIFKRDYQIIKDFEAANGKFANTYGNVVVIDSSYFIGELADFLSENFGSVINGALISAAFNQNNIIETVRNIPINDYAMQVDVVLKNREQYYLGTPKENEKLLVAVQTELALELPVKSTAPVYEALKSLDFIKLFLVSIFMTIVFFMILLSAMLIYSLMIADVDEKTYEMGMLRALGLRRSSIMHLIILQSVMFSVVGLIIGISLSATLNVGLRYFVFEYTKNKTTYWLSFRAVLSGLAVGSLIPIFSNISAISRALNKNIRDSLNLMLTTVNEVIVKIIKLENFGISIFEITLGLTFTAIGIITYYFVPAIFSNNRLDIFFLILNLILISMIIGITFL